MGNSIPYGQRSSYINELSNALKRTEIYDVSYALANDPFIYEKMRKYIGIQGPMDTLSTTVVGTSYYFEPASPAEDDYKAVPIWEATLSKLQGLTAAKSLLCQGAILRGSAWAEIQGDFFEVYVVPFGRMRLWCPTRLVDVDKRRFYQVPNKDGTTEWFKREIGDYGSKGTQVDLSHYIRFVCNDDEASLGNGRGLDEALYYPFRKATLLESQLQQFGARFAQGERVYKVNNLYAGANAESAAERRQEFLSIVDKARTDFAIVLDKEDEYHLVDAPAEGYRFINETLQSVKDEMRTYILGSSLPSQPHVSGGSYAVAKVQERVSEKKVDFYRVSIDETFSRDLLSLIFKINEGAIREQGLDISGPAYFHTRDLDQFDPQIRAQVVQTAINIGLKVREDEAYDQMGLTPPGDHDRYVEKQPEQPEPVAKPQEAPGANQHTSASPQSSEAREAKDAKKGVNSAILDMQRGHEEYSWLTEHEEASMNPLSIHYWAHRAGSN